MNSSIATIKLLALIVAFHCSPGFGQSNPMQVNERDAWATPLLVLPPSFPKDIPAETLPVEIRVEGLVTTDGRFAAPTYAERVGNRLFAPSEEKQAFVRAVADVIQEWRFRPAIDTNGCKTKESQAILVVYFELKEGNPSVSISSPRIETAEAGRESTRRAGFRFARRPKAEFPPAALREGVEGSAEILLEVNGEGQILRKTVVSSLPHALFGKAALDGLSHATVSKSDAAEKQSVQTACTTVTFNFCFPRPEAQPIRYRNPHCSR